MALRNYLYAKHDPNLEISTRINKASAPGQTTTNHMPSSSTIAPARHTIPRSAQHHHVQEHAFLSQQVNKVARDLNDFSLDGKNCTKLCESCKCEKEGKGSNSLDETVSRHGDVQPSLRVEVADNEIDFTNAI